jgi:hypothetical protein
VPIGQWARVECSGRGVTKLERQLGVEDVQVVQVIEGTSLPLRDHLDILDTLEWDPSTIPDAENWKT